MKRHLPTKESFQLACEEGDLERVKRWRVLGMIPDSYPEDALYSSAIHGHVELVHHFLTNTWSPETIETAICRTILESPCNESHEEIIWMLLVRLGDICSMGMRYFESFIRTTTTHDDRIEYLLEFIQQINKFTYRWDNKVKVCLRGWKEHLLEIYSVRYLDAFYMPDDMIYKFRHQHTLVLFVRERFLSMDLLQLLGTYLHK